MAVYSTFFLCEPEKLLDAFPRWKSPLAQAVTRKVNNPFTGQQMTIESTEPEWPDIEPAEMEIPERIVVAGQGDYAAYLEARIPPTVRFKPHWCAKGLTSIELNPLVEAAGIQNSELSTALYAHPSLSSGLEQFPPGFVDAIKLANEAALRKVAEKWAATMSTPDFTHSVTGERIEEDLTADEAMSILSPITDLCRKQAGNARMYLLLEW